MLPWLATAVAVTLQIAYPLTSGDGRAAVTVLSVLAFLAAAVSHAAAVHGPAWAAGATALAAGTGLLAESVGLRTGWPFGHYAYGSALGPDLAGVPVVVPLAWAMMGLPALMLGRRCARSPAWAPSGRAPAARWAVTALVGGAALTAWDLFLDPQMVAEGYWTWSAGGPALNGIPLSNAAGWLLVGTLLTGALAALPIPSATPTPTPTPSATATATATATAPLTDVAPTDVAPTDDRVPMALLCWTCASSVLANLAFFGRPGVALAGGAAMGPLLGLAVLLSRRDAARGWAGTARKRGLARSQV
ncbi:carotenoid biosynthesis protein [Parafrankia discariae]|uniref:carotenoid biosynthesis protein n=1 Tax=Parafrankia discariae TaxID=365528 RepID=UPI00036F01CC|nr:carotenoid biosynthesis protein [Parafrankia discariae]